jgi:lysyl-tRNA synthetase class 2
MYEFDESRLEKVASLREDGIEPYPHNLTVLHTAAQAIEMIGERDNETLSEDTTEVTIAGRLMFRNLMGKAGFARIQDRSGRIQVYVKKNIIGDDAFAIWKRLDVGDHVHVTGRFMRTRTGEATIQARTLVLSGKCIASMPDKHKGIKDIEFKSRQRYVDLFMDPESAETFRRRSEVVRYTREFFSARDYLEVETPMMHVIPGGATARPFITHHNALDMELYMRVAPELYLKRLVVGGFERVFEINRNFRNEGLSTRHNPEFTMLEFYEAYQTWDGLMELTEDLVSGMAEAVTGSHEVEYGEETLQFSKPWRRMKMSDAIAEYSGMSVEDVKDPEALKVRWLQDHPKDAKDPRMPTTVGKWYELFMDAYVEDKLVQPTFITHFPVEISPLSRRSETEDGIAERFELFIAGREIANGFNELNDPEDQAARFEDQVASREAGDDEAMYFDADYIRALTYGLPPTAGEGVGIDRLVMLLTNRASIREVILFPTMRPEQNIGSAAEAGDAEDGESADD